MAWDPAVNKPIGDFSDWFRQMRAERSELGNDQRQDYEERVRVRAYQIWVREGWPDDAHEDHWHRACQEIAREEGLQLK